MSKSLFPPKDSNTRLRLRRQRMALYSFALIWLGIVVGIELSIFDPSIPHTPIFIALYASNALVYLLIRSGLSLRLNDPSLTIPQMMLATLAITVVLHYTSDIRGAMQSIYFMVMTFGVFALDRLRMFAMSLFILASYTGLVIYEWTAQPQSQIFGISFGLWMILALGLAWFVYVGGYIYNLQQRIREQRKILRDNQQRLTDTNAQLHKAMTRLEEIAVRDELTGLFNRRHFLARLDEELSRAERGGTRLHIALIDLDHFKEVNDAHGHQVGDLVLRKFADVAQRELRRSDVVARYGGEEFIALFAEGESGDIAQVLERLRIDFARACVRDINPEMTVTLSAGLAAWHEGDTPDSIIQRADQALYRAKADGRNRLVVA